jgi:hypothetical protein
MDTKGKLNDAEKETVLIAVGELAEEQAQNTKALNDLITTVNVHSSTLQELKEKIDKPKPVIVTADTRPMQKAIDKGVTDIKLLVGSKPQPIIRKFQILLFPDQNAKLFYKIVFGRWVLFLLLMLLITRLYDFSVHWSDNQKEVQQKELENDHIKKAWYYLYEQENKAGKRLMDSAYSKSGRAY